MSETKTARLTKISARGHKSCFVFSMSDGRIILIDRRNEEGFMEFVNREFKGGVRLYEIRNLTCLECYNPFLSVHERGMKEVACECKAKVPTDQAHLP